MTFDKQNTQTTPTTNQTIQNNKNTIFNKYSSFVGSKKSFNFDEFCELLENLPKAGMIDEKKLLKAFQTEDVDCSGFVSRAQLYSLLTDNGSDPLKREDVDEMMDDCGVGDMFKYSGDQNYDYLVIHYKNLT